MPKRTFNHGSESSRRRKACERLGDPTPRCLLSGETNPHALQKHHIAGQKFGDEVITISLNHHARASDLQKDHPSKIPECISPLEFIGHSLLGLGDMIAIAVEDCHRHPITQFLTCLREWLQEIGLRLINMARARPNETFGLVP
jgi:hypothetical protein